jgi:hypothetical protein
MLNQDADHSPPPRAEVKYSWSYTSTPTLYGTANAYFDIS